MTRRAFAAFAAASLRAAADLKISRYELFSVRMPFAERVREAWIQSWTHQKREQNDYVLHFVRLHTSSGLAGIGEAKMPRAEAEAKLKTMLGRTASEFLHDDSLRGLLIAVYDLIAQSANQPIAKLLNPKAKDRILPT